MSKPIEVVKLGRARRGFKILPSWRRPLPKKLAKKIDLWIPELAPSLSLLKHYRRGGMSWKDLAFAYACELRKPSSVEYLKPLALLSMRRKLVLLCDCADGLRCPGRILASELDRCRKDGDFILR